jgi:hypothetical protein
VTSPKLRIYIVDPTYQFEESRSRSASFRRGLEAEFEVKFKRRDIGAGASLPAFLCEGIPLSIGLPATALALFLAGQRIERNLKAWGRVWLRVKRFLTRSPMFNRDAAALLVLGVLIEQEGLTPKYLRIVGYRAIPRWEKLKKLPRLTEIEADPPEEHLSAVKHLFEVEADGAYFSILVDGHETTLKKISRSQRLARSKIKRTRK